MVKSIFALLILMFSCSAMTADSEVIIGASRSLVTDLALAQRSVDGLASLSITTVDLATAGIRTSIVESHVNEETKAARINNIGIDPSSADVISAFVALTDDEALQFTTTVVLSCGTIYDCVTNATLLCETLLSGSIANVGTPSNNNCPVICGKNDVLGAALITCG
jgi:hypothetical protein